MYVTKEEQVYASDEELVEKKAEAILNSSYMKQLWDTDGEITLFNRTDDCMEVGDSVVTMGKKAIQSNVGEKTGYIFINISGDYLVDVTEDGI